MSPLNKKLNEVSRVKPKGKTEESQIKLDLEDKLREANDNMIASLDRCAGLEKDLTAVRSKLDKSI